MIEPRSPSAVGVLLGLEDNSPLVVEGFSVLPPAGCQFPGKKNEGIEPSRPSNFLVGAVEFRSKDSCRSESLTAECSE